MFTGIITGVGRIAAVHAISSLEPTGSSTSVPDQFGKRLLITAPNGYLNDVGLGDSIAINGACMTVTSFDADKNEFTIDISAESLQKTANLAQLGTALNLEKALRANDRLGGHIVSGHVDGIGRISYFASVGESWELRILCPTGLGKFIAYKGSITVNGVSLTVNKVVDALMQNNLQTELSINLIPHTLENTALGGLQTGDYVNLEVDTVARYVERMLSFEKIS
ncbi:MAG TPA: riboflavin synthase [Burkholderiaceae bacterium]|nr:riboflavin synthase [Burkholderiaceae bacterium]